MSEFIDLNDIKVLKELDKLLKDQTVVTPDKEEIKQIDQLLIGVNYERENKS